jgi:predicted heme/steroid binding protein
MTRTLDFARLSALGAVVVLALTACAQDAGDEAPTVEDTVVSQSESVTPDSGGTQLLTLELVATHNSAESCWTAIDGSVYDLTTWVDQHPGGAGNILSICGIDGTSAFNQKHASERKVEATRDSFLLGALGDPAP